MLNVLFIEADNQKNLGGSCIRDIRNVDHYLNKEGYEKRRQTLLLSIDNTQKLNDKNDKCSYDFLRNYQNCFKTFIENISENDSVLILISGHGYQSYNKEEKDSMDEYISFGNGHIYDNLLYSLLIDKCKDKCKRVVCLTDTCHSGTMFDLEDKTSHKRNIISISACLDNQLASCDISNVGFGGSLTVHLLDIPNSLKKLLEDNEDSVKSIVNSLKNKLKCLNQNPLLTIL